MRCGRSRGVWMLLAHRATRFAKTSSVSAGPMRPGTRSERREGFFYLPVTANVCSWSREGSLVDTVDLELDRLISRRASQDLRPDPDEEEELWKASVRRYNARRQEANRLAWCDYFERLAACLRARAEEYDHRAQRLLEDQQIGE